MPLINMKLVRNVRGNRIERPTVATWTFNYNALVQFHYPTVWTCCYSICGQLRTRGPGSSV